MKTKTRVPPADRSVPYKDAVANGSKPKQPSLRIFSYNIRHGQGMDGKIDLKRISAVIAKEKPDIVALQEVDVNCIRTGYRDLAKELGTLLDMEVRFGKAISLQGGEYGNAVLSSLPIIETIHHAFPRNGNKDIESRCALEVKVQANGRGEPISFISIHIENSFESVRVQQIQSLLNALRNTSQPVILAGDFNGEKTDASLKLFEEPEWKILDKDGKKTFPADQPTIEIDFFILRGFSDASIQHQVIDERMASDHRPIAAVLTF